MAASSLVPRVLAIALLGLAATAGLTYAAGSSLGTTAPAPQAAPAKPTAPLVVPDVAGQAFVFAKGTLEESGFAWRVAGPVHGYPANTVVSQFPAPGTRLVDTGAPLVTLTLKRNGRYKQAGEAEDVSRYAATALEPAGLAGPVGPAAPAR